jgi:hypothetical protein
MLSTDRPSQKEIAMPELTDRERLERLAQQELEQTREAEARRKSEAEQAAASEARQLADSRSKTDELVEWCKLTFSGFKLPDSGHEVSVGRAGESKLYNLQSDKVSFVALSIQHWHDSTGDFQGDIPLVLAHFISGRYRIHFGGRVQSAVGREECSTLAEAKERLIAIMASFDRTRLGVVFAQVRQCFRR